jgi:hypothetical protein
LVTISTVLFSLAGKYPVVGFNVAVLLNVPHELSTPIAPKKRKFNVNFFIVYKPLRGFYFY